METHNLAFGFIWTPCTHHWQPAIMWIQYSSFFEKPQNKQKLLRTLLKFSGWVKSTNQHVFRGLSFKKKGDKSLWMFIYI